MATLQEILNLGTGFPYEGKVYQVAELTIEARARFGKWLEDRAVEAAYRRKNSLPDELMNRLLSVLNQDIAAGVYEWGGEACCKALQTPAGATFALYLALSEHHPEIDEDTARGMVEAKYKEVAEALEKAIGDPKALAALEALVPGGTFSRS